MTPFPRNSLALFKRQKPKNIPKASLKPSTLASDRYLFSHLYIARQQREGDLGKFFMHENQPYPSAISELGSLGFGKKSALLSYISKGIHNPKDTTIVDVKVFDGAEVVHSLPVSSATTFDEYAYKVFCPFLERSFRNTSRIDVVWDDYRENSLKEATRERRGQGVRKVEGHVKLPKNWQAFLQDPLNKKELFSFLTRSAQTFSWPDGKQVILTLGKLMKNDCFISCVFNF